MLIRMLLITSIFVGTCFITKGHAQKREKWMSNERMEDILIKHIDKVEGEAGNWQLTHGDRLLFVLTDESNNRMRIFTPIIEQRDLRRGEMELLLEANFHSALDAKYCIYEGFVISVFTHPLKELTEDQLLSAAGQVLNLAETFGYTYSSTSLMFGTPTEKKVKEEKPAKKS